MTKGKNVFINFHLFPFISGRRWIGKSDRDRYMTVAQRQKNFNPLSTQVTVSGIYCFFYFSLFLSLSLCLYISHLTYSNFLSSSLTLSLFYLYPPFFFSISIYLTSSFSLFISLPHSVPFTVFLFIYLSFSMYFKNLSNIREINSSINDV